MHTDWRSETERAQVENERTVDPGAQSSVNANSGTAWPVLEQAMEDLKTALVERKVEPICSAYQSVRHAVRGMKTKDMFGMIEQAAGPQAKEMILSAHAHRECFMCQSGSMACDQCGGSGQIDPGRTCPSCDGLGLADCTFCRGTGWADAQMLPAELRRAVEEKHYVRAMDDLRSLQQRLVRVGINNLPRLSPEERREMASLAMRLQARLEESRQRGLVNTQNPAVFDQAIAGLSHILQKLQPTEPKAT
jgi:hypothetical protein